MTESSIPTDEQQRLIAGYVLYDLSPEEAATLSEWMAADPAIAQDIALMQQALEATYTPAPTTPPAHLRGGILAAHQANMAALASTPQAALPQDAELQTATTSSLASDTPVASPFNRPSRQYGRFEWGFAAMAAALIAGLGISNLVLWRSLQTARAQLDQPQPSAVRTVALNPIDANTTPNTATALVQIDAATLEATLGAENLPPLPDGQVYVLWTVLKPDAPFTTDTKGAILTQTFTVDAQGRVSTEVPLPPVYKDLQWVKAIAITVESADAPQRHESQPILLETL